MWPSCRSRGAATEEAMISGLAPGNVAMTLIVGKSICGRGDTGRKLKATAPASATAAVNSVVATGRWMNGAERFTTREQERVHRLPPRRGHGEAWQPDDRRTDTRRGLCRASKAGSKAGRRRSRCPADGAVPNPCRYRAPEAEPQAKPPSWSS